MISTLRIALLLGMLGYVSYKDLKTREVSDLIWVVFGGLAMVINFYEFIIGSLSLLTFALSFGFMLGFTVLTWFLGLFGGADLLAFLTIGLLTPYTPFNPIFGFRPIIFPLSLVTNAVITSFFLMLWILVSNLVFGVSWGGLETEPIWKKVAALISGRRVDASKIRGPPYDYPIESIDADGRRRLSIIIGIMDDDKAWEQINSLKKKGIEEIWLTRSIPFLLSLLAGLVITLVVGDTMLYFIDLIIR